MVLVKGVTHTLAGCLSRFPDKKKTCSELENHFTFMIASRSLRCKETGFTPEDPHIKKIARIGSEDPDYVYIINCIREKTPIGMSRRKSS